MASSVTFGPDGRTLAAAGGNTIVLWDLVSGRQLRSVGVPGLGPTSVFSPDGRTLGSVDISGIVALWDVATGRNLRTLRVPCTLAGCLLGFTSRGDAVAVGADPSSKAIEIWDVSGGRMLRRVNAEPDALVMSSDCRILSANEHNKKQLVKLWEIPSGKELRTLSLGPYYSSDQPLLGLSPDGRTLALFREHRIEVWDIAGGKQQDFDVGADRFKLFAPDGRTLVSQSWYADETVHLWDASTGQQIKALGKGEGIKTVTFSPDGHRVALGRQNGLIDIRDLENDRLLVSLGQHVSGVGLLQFSPDGGILANATYSSIKLLSMTTGAQLRTLTPYQSEFGRNLGLPPARCLAFSPDGSIIAAGGERAGLWDVARGRELPARSSAEGILSVAFRPDGRMLAWGSDDQTIKLWEMPGGREVQTLDVNSKVSSIAFSPEGTTLVSGSWDGIVRLWDVTRGGLIKSFVASKNSIDTIAVSPDGKILVTGNGPSDSAISLWEMPTGRKRVTLDRTLFIAFSRDGLTFAARDAYAPDAMTSTVSIRETSTGRKLRILARDPGSAFSPDWKLAGAGDKDAVRLSDGTTGKELATLFALDESDWVVSDSEGRFDTGALDQMNGLGWVFPDDPFRALNPEIFVRDYYQPKLLSRLLRGDKLPEVRALSGLNRAQPDVQIVKVESETDSELVSITVKVASTTVL